jgi:hypothetical protein
MPHDIFISYSSKDRNIADSICAKLEEQGIRCWMAPRDILPGQNYAESIIKAINSCKVFVLFWTANANTSGHILNEVDQAFNQGNTIIPFRIEEVEPSMSLRYYIGRAHWLNAFSPPLEEHIRTLAEIILGYLGRPLELKPEPLPEPSEPVQAETVLNEPAGKEPEDHLPAEALIEPATLPAAEKEEVVRRPKPRGGISIRRKVFLPIAAGILLLAFLVWLLASGALHGLSPAKQVPTPGSTATTVSPAPTNTLVHPVVTATPLPAASTPTATKSPTFTSTPQPAWVTDFSTPILNAIANRPPDIQDDFSARQPGWNFQVVKNNDPGLNCSNTALTVSNGRLQLKSVPPRGCYAIASLTAVMSDYVLQVDVDLSRLSPGQNSDISFLRRNITLHSDGSWGSVSCHPDCYFSDEGQVPLDPAQLVTIQMISYGTRFAFFINGLPAYYSETGGSENSYAVRFSVDGGKTSSSGNIAEFDNLKVWDLYKVDLSSNAK